MQLRQEPPGRTSPVTECATKPVGPSQRDSCSGSVQARNTTSRGAANTRVIVSSPSTVAVALSSPVIVGSLLDLSQMVVEAVEAALPELPVALQPAGDVLQRARVEPTGPPLRRPAAADQAGAFEDPQMFGDRLEADRERLGQLVDRRLSAGELGQDRAARRVGERGQRGAELIDCHLLIHPVDEPYS